MGGFSDGEAVRRIQKIGEAADKTENLPARGPGGSPRTFSVNGRYNCISDRYIAGL